MVSVPAEYDPSQGHGDSYGPELSKTRKIETERRYVEERLKMVMSEVIAMEVSMGISVRWTIEHPEYVKILRYIGQRRYEKALDNLQRLVIQRLFELHKMNQSMNGELTDSFVSC
jgi:hypothetical protein